MFLECFGSVPNNRTAYAFAASIFIIRRTRMDLFDNFLEDSFIDIVTKIDTFEEEDFDIMVVAITYWLVESSLYQNISINIFEITFYKSI